MAFRVACAGLAPLKAQVDQNLDRIAAAIRQAVEEGADLVLLPEAVVSGYFLEGGVHEASLTAEELGAKWVGDTFAEPPVRLDAAIIFAPAGEVVPAALKALEKGATLVLGGIHMSPIPELDYNLLYGERVVRSVANNTRKDGHEFLAEAAAIPVKTSVQTFPLEAANEALIALKHDAIKGAGVLGMA